MSRVLGDDYHQAKTVSQKIGFYVSLKYTRTYGSRQIVKFDDILVNDGNGYDDRTGVFTCPVGVTYMFVVDVMINKYTRLSLQFNKITVAYVHRDNSYTKYPYIQTSKTILLKLNKGEYVKLVCDHNIVYIHATKSSGFTRTFLY